MRKISYLFIIAGILLASYPKLKDFYSIYWQEKLLKEMMVNNEQQSESIESSYRELNEIFEEERETRVTVDVEEVEDEVIDDITSEERTTAKVKGIGIIEIQKIGLRLPILEGTTKANLNKGAGHLSGTDLPGEIGNVAIAAHRAHKYGMLFNRLDELEIGDSIVIERDNKSYHYTVYEKKVVDPTDTSVLKRNSRDKILTLITCTPLYDATHRLIIHAKL